MGLTCGGIEGYDGGGGMRRVGEGSGLGVSLWKKGGGNGGLGVWENGGGRNRSRGA